ncbi:MAG TPA: hypothetical protein PLO67_04145 [Saprospiraceae bacterium]|nr:hypothetical protein [Saprospiraceae bacterium]HPI05154.1 hypothetical protein [Saprospiraceae bacterium]
MEKNRAYFKALLADNALDTLFDELFTLLSFHKMRYKDRVVDDKYDALVLLSGKLNAARESNQLGMSSPEDFNTELSRVNFSLLELLNDLPDSFFEQAKEAETIVPGAKKEVKIPPGIGNGLFWMASVFMMMICLGSLFQHNMIPFAFTLVATVICLPPAYDFLSRSLGIALSNSIRILLVIVLTSVGLSFAPKRAGNDPGSIDTSTPRGY